MSFKKQIRALWHSLSPTSAADSATDSATAMMDTSESSASFSQQNSDAEKRRQHQHQRHRKDHLHHNGAHALVSEDSERGEDDAVFRVGTKLKWYCSDSLGFLVGSVVDVVSSRRTLTYKVHFAVNDEEKKTGMTAEDEEGHEEEAVILDLTERQVEHGVNLLRVKVGVRLSILSKQDNCYYEATVTKHSKSKRKNRRRACFCVYYDAGRREWIDLTKHRFRIIASTSEAIHTNKDETVKMEEDAVPSLTLQKTAALSHLVNANNPVSQGVIHPDCILDSVTVGSRVSFYWAEDNAYYQANVIRMRTTSNNKAFFLEFDDGLRDWMDLRGLQCSIVSSEGGEQIELDEEENNKEVLEKQVVVERDNNNEMTCAVPEVKVQPEKDGNEMEAEVETTKDTRTSQKHSNNNNDGDDGGDEVTSVADSDVEHVKPEPNPDICLVTVGSRLGVYWPDDRTYYNATVEEYRKDKRLPWHILYEDGEQEWINLHQHSFRLIPESAVVRRKRGPNYKNGIPVEQVHPKTGNVVRTFSSLRLASGSSGVCRVELTRLLQSKKERQKLGGFFWRYAPERPERSSTSNTAAPSTKVTTRESPRKETEPVHPKGNELSEVKVGTRVAVWWKADRKHYKATVNRFEPDHAKSWRLVYDDGESEWINLRKHQFYIVRNKNKEGRGEKDRTVQKAKAQSKASMGLGVNAEKVQVGTRVSIWWGGDKRYFAGTVTSIRSRGESDQFFVEYDDGEEEWIHLKREKFHILDSEKPRRGRRRARTEDTELVDNEGEEEEDDDDDDDDRRSSRPPRRKKPRTAATKPGHHGMPIEQIDPKTGKVVEVFPSIRLAIQSAGITRSEMKRALNVNEKQKAAGFFWRLASDDSSQPSQSTHGNRKPVEKCCPLTGDVLEEFASVTDASRSTGSAIQNISSVCEGRHHTAAGYFWRWKGSGNLPRGLEGMVKIVQASKTVDGPVDREFWNIEEAALWIGSDADLVSRWCRENKGTKGYFWKYDIRNPVKGEEHVSKRLRIRLVQWEEGTVERYISDTGLYDIRLDNGRVESVDLKMANYKFRDEGGNEPVEQVCLTTGKVLHQYPSVESAATSLNMKKDRILPVLRNLAASSCGYLWRYADSEKMPIKKKRGSPGKSIVQTNVKTGKIIAIFASGVAAAKELGMNRAEIRVCCTNSDGIAPCGTYRLSYKEAPEES